MKRLLLIVLPLLLIVGCSKPVNESSLVDKNGVKYQQDSQKPYSGEVFRLYDTGEKVYQGTYENGLLIDYSYLNKDGSVKEPINYETTLVERGDVYYTKDTNKPYSGPVFSLNDKGLNKRESILEDGKMITRTDFRWYENGQKNSEVTYKDGKEDGLSTEWYETGQKKSEGTFKDGEKDGLTTSWYENGQKSSERTLKDGKEDGLVTVWYETGQKKSEGTFKDGEKDGLTTSWYENGQKSSERTLKDGKEDGLRTEWHQTGQKKSESTYKDGLLYGLSEWFRNGKNKDNVFFKENESGTPKMVFNSGDYVPEHKSSSILWECNWLAGRAHNGDISIKEGSVKIEDDALVYANFIVDMNSMKCFDLKNEGMNKKLIGHLKSNDFFDVQNHPESSLHITSSKNISDNRFKFIGHLTIKNITNNVIMNGVVDRLGDGYKIDIKFDFDRSKYDVRYKSASFFSNLGDRIISDNVSLNVKLKIRKNTLK